MNVKQIQASETRFGLLQGIILLLGLLTAAIHGILLNIRMGGIDPLFTLNGIGFVALLAAYFLPQFIKYRSLVRWILIAYTAVTIIAWVVIGEREILGYVTALIEVVLIVALYLDGR